MELGQRARIANKAKADLKTDKKSILALIREVNIQNVVLLFAFVCLKNFGIKKLLKKI